MGRPLNIIRPVRLATTLPEDIRAKLDLYLYSPIEGRVPKGAYQKFLIERIQEFFNNRGNDVQPRNPVENNDSPAEGSGGDSNAG